MLKDIYKNELEKVIKNDDGLIKYIVNDVADFVGLGNGKIYAIRKKRLQTHFCFGYGMYGISNEEDYNMAEGARKVASTSWQYFITENTKDINDKIASLETALLEIEEYGADNVDDRLCIVNMYKDSDVIVDIKRLDDINDYVANGGDIKWQALDQEDIITLINAYDKFLDKMQKRCLTYLKRYGTEKLHTWTYLID